MTTTTVEQTKKVETVRRRVWINYWQNSRGLVIESTRILLEATNASCSHCPTCQSRVAQFMEVLKEKPGIVHNWTWICGSNWLIFARPEKVEPLQYLKETLNLLRIEYS